MAATRKPYHGLERKLVLAFDIGTTFSGVSYAILDPGVVPEILGVTRFPGQGANGDSKIPTVLIYDKKGQIKAVGAEASDDDMNQQTEDNKWHKIEWFKLHLRPPKRASDDGWADLESPEGHIPPLPPKRTAIAVLSDFMKYLYDCSRTYIQETHALGENDLWSSLEGHIDFILSHPNGWEGPQQSQYRKAATMAGLVPNTQSGHARIHFVTEGEASLNFCIGNGLASDIISSGKGVIIVDAGGGTVDLSAYSKNEDSFEEISSPECLFQGSVYVSRRAHAFLNAKLKNSTYGNKEDLQVITETFDKGAKLRFRNKTQASFVHFGSARDKDLTVGIQSGKLKLEGTEMASFFEPAIDSIIQAIEKQSEAAHTPVSAVFLVGGFAASDWLFTELKTQIESKGLTLYRPDSHLNKAVAHGAVSFHVDHFVSVRVARFTYGVRCATPFIPWDPEHRARSHLLVRDISGELYVPDAFSVILAKGTRVSETTEFREVYLRDFPSRASAKNASVSVTSYTGSFPDPHWVDTEPDRFFDLCTVSGNTSKIARTLEPHTGVGGRTYFRQCYDVVLLLGLTELKAQLSWMEDGVEKRSPASVVYDSMATPIKN